MNANKIRLTFLLSVVIITCMPACSCTFNKHLKESWNCEWPAQGGGVLQIPVRYQSMAINDRYIYLVTSNSCGMALNIFDFDGLRESTFNIQGNDNINGNINGTSICIDNEGNIYIAGHFKYEIDFDFNPVSTNICRSYDGAAFLAKYDQSVQLLWVDTWENGVISSMYFDSRDDLYLTLTHSDETDMDPGPSQTLSISQNDKVNTALIKLNSEGQYIWSNVFNVRICLNVVIDNEDKVITCGSTKFQFELEGQIIEPQQSDIYIIEWENDGAFSKYYTISDGASYSPMILEIDNAQRLYISGLISNHLVNDDESDSFIIRYNRDTEYEERVIINAEHFLSICDLALGSDGHIFITGRNMGRTDYDPDSSEYFLDTRNGEPFLAEYDNNLEFLNAGICVGYEYFDSGRGVVIDENGNIYLHGICDENYFLSKVTF